MNITLQQLLALDAVVSRGSIQAGAEYLNKTHPTIVTTLKKLEDQLGFALFNRSEYKLSLTEQGRSFYNSSKRILNDLHNLKTHAEQLGEGQEPELNIVLGDLTPIADALKILRSFSLQHPLTRLNLLFENLYGPRERLLNGDVDLIIHHIDKSDPRYEYKDFCQVPVIPVVAPGFLKIPIHRQLKYADLRDYTQCIIRDTAIQKNHKSHFVNENSPHITVGDQQTKKQVILQSMAWGHMPEFLIKKELENGDLISIEGEFIKGDTRDIVVARISSEHVGIMLDKLWQCF